MYSISRTRAILPDRKQAGNFHTHDDVIGFALGFPDVSAALQTRRDLETIGGEPHNNHRVYRKTL